MIRIILLTLLLAAGDSYAQTVFDPDQIPNLQNLNGAVIDSQVPDDITITVSESDVTDHEAAITITESQISDLGSYETADSDIAKVNESETITGDWDAGGGTFQIPNSTSLPGTCEVGDTYMDTDATTGQRFYLCESTNTWAVQGDGGGGGGISNVVEDTTPQLGGQLDVNGNAIGDGTRELVTFTEDASAVNHVEIENEATGSGPTIRAAGDDTNIDLNIDAKGSGNVIINGLTITSLPDPDSDDLLFWDDSDGGVEFLTLGDGLLITVNELEFNYAETLAGNPALGADECVFSSDGTGGVMICEGNTADTNEGLIVWNPTSDITITLPNATDTLVGRATTDTLTNKTIDANGTGNSISNIDVADFANGTDGELITWDAAGAPTTVAVGTSGHVLTSNGAGAAPTFQASAGGGNVTAQGTPVNGQVGVWTSSTGLEGDAAFTFDDADDTLVIGASGALGFGAVDILDDTAGTTALQNIDSIDATTEFSIETAVDLADLQGTLTVAKGGTGATTLTDGGVLLGSGTDAATAMAVLADGEMIVGDGTTDPVPESGATLRTSIGVGTGDSPQFTGIELGHATDTTLARVSAGVVSIEGDNIVDAGTSLTDSSYWPGGSLVADGTNCADPAKATINSGPVLYSVICTDSASSAFYGQVTMPDGYDGGTVTFELAAIQTAADTNVLDFDFSAQCRGDSDAVNSTWGTAQNASITFSTANDIEHATTSAVTGNGTCTAGDTLFWRAVMDNTATTTAVATAHVVGVKMEYTTVSSD